MANPNGIATRVQKPAHVRLIISLLYAHAVISLLLDSTLSILNEGFSTGSLILHMIIFLVGIFLVFAISKGKTWPRNLLLFIFLWLSVPFYILYQGSKLNSDISSLLSP
jgi:tryptophan-rich sensory protein